MPRNVTVKQRGIAEKIACLEEMISIVPKHKGTDHLRADLRRQLAKLKTDHDTHKKLGGHTTTFHIEKEGAGQVVLVGPTNTGKSTLVAALTNAEPEISSAPHTTWKPTPGMMKVENFQVQLVDTPSLDPEYTNPGVFDLVRRADLVMVVLDLQADPFTQYETTLAMLSDHRISLNKPGNVPEIHSRKSLSFRLSCWSISATILSRMKILQYCASYSRVNAPWSRWQPVPDGISTV